MNLFKISKKYSLKYLILFLIITFLFYIFFNLTNTHIRESLKDMSINTNLSTDFASNFCNDNSGGKSEAACNSLTRNNCMKTSCCIWTNDNKCAAGDKDGLKFKDADKNSKLEYYYFKNECYGECPKI